MSWPLAFSMKGTPGPTGDTGPEGPQGPPGSGSGSGSFTTLYPSSEMVSCGTTMYFTDANLEWDQSKRNEFSSGHGVAWNGSYWLAVGENTESGVSMASTIDRDTWGPLTNPLTRGYGIAWNGTYWIATGENSDNTVSIIKSSDAVNWTTFNPFEGAGGPLAWNGSSWLALSKELGVIATSPDGMNWTIQPVGPGANYCVAANNSTWMIGGIGGIRSSPDGITWSNYLPSLNVCTCIGWNGSMWIAGGTYTESSNMLARSSNGITWTDIEFTFEGLFPKSITWNGSLWVVSSTGMAYATSPDGLTWTLRSDTQLNVLASKDLLTTYIPTIATNTLYFKSEASVQTISTISTFVSTFVYTGNSETFSIPAGVSSLTIEVLGAGGANAGGGGAYISGTYAVQPGDSNIQIYVGQGGQTINNALSALYSMGFMRISPTTGSAANTLGLTPITLGGGGGGASGILFQNGTDILIASGGAGGFFDGSSIYRGGAGGLINGSEPSGPESILAISLALQENVVNSATTIETTINGTVSFTPIQGVQSASFDGSVDNFISLPFTPGNSFTISYYYNLNVSGEYTPWSFSSDEGAGMRLTINGTSAILQVPSTNGDLSFPAFNTPASGIWIQIVTVLNINNGKMSKVYCDGLEVSSLLINGDLINSQNLVLGKGTNGGLSNFNIYNETLNANTINRIYISQLGTYRYVSGPPVLLLRAITYSGSGPWQNELGSERALMDTGVIAKNSDGNGIVFNGSTAWDLNVVLENSWSLNIWYKSTDATTTDLAYIISQNSLQNNRMFISYDGGQVSGGFTNTTTYTGTPYSLTLNEWVNIQIIWDGTNIYTYINGSLIGTELGGESISYNTGYSIGGVQSTGNFIIGEIGQICIYNYAIDASQVLSDYNTSLPDFST